MVIFYMIGWYFRGAEMIKTIFYLNEARYALILSIIELAQ